MDVEPSIRARSDSAPLALGAFNPYFSPSSSGPSASVGSRDPTDYLSELADVIAQRYIEGQLAEPETPYQLRSGTGS